MGRQGDAQMCERLLCTSGHACCSLDSPDSNEEGLEDGHNVECIKELESSGEPVLLHGDGEEHANENDIGEEVLELPQ